MSTSPCSHSCMTAIAVKVLVIDPIRKTVSSAIGVFAAVSASPYPWHHASESSRTIPTARPADGQLPRTLATVALTSMSSNLPVGWPLGPVGGPVAAGLTPHAHLSVTTCAYHHGASRRSAGFRQGGLRSRRRHRRG